MPADMKGIIMETFAGMLRHRDVDKITVKALIEECHISRQTFYYHFQDLMDVIESLIRQSVQHTLERSLKAENPEAAVGIFITTAYENRALIQKLLASQKRDQVERIMVQALKMYLAEMLRSRVADISLRYLDLDLELDFYAFGITGLLLKYCNRPNVDIGRLSRQICRLFERSLIALGVDTAQNG